MFTGIIEEVATVKSLIADGGNLHLVLKSQLAPELKIDQSVAHNGTCLTVVETDADTFRVTAIAETLDRTNLGALKEGDAVNLERCMRFDGRLDGHIVQGHVDRTGTVKAVEEEDGSWKYWFTFDDPEAEKGQVTVEKGSVCVNGVSLTVVDSEPDGFSVAIIPYTYEHTNFHRLKVGDKVNLEFDILGKYVARYLGQLKLS
ncbi:MAG: riboflavin synthase [Salibacteraceae bacterium]